MKKFLSLMIGMTLYLSITACSNQVQTQEETMFIEPSDFSEETMQVIDILGQDVLFFDFVVDDSVKSYSIETFIYKDNDWQDYGSTSANIEDADNRIAIKSSEEGYEIHTMDDGGMIGYSADTVYDAFDNTTQSCSYKITSQTDIVLDEEIVLWCKIGNDGNGITINNDFRNLDCTAGMAFTVTFSEEVLQ